MTMVPFEYELLLKLSKSVTTTSRFLTI
jgi:hypothetical protein